MNGQLYIRSKVSIHQFTLIINQSYCTCTGVVKDLFPTVVTAAAVDMQESSSSF
jgi:hypothetical protein